MVIGVWGCVWFSWFVLCPRRSIFGLKNGVYVRIWIGSRRRIPKFSSTILWCCVFARCGFHGSWYVVTQTGWCLDDLLCCRLLHQKCLSRYVWSTVRALLKMWFWRNASQKLLIFVSIRCVLNEFRGFLFTDIIIWFENWNFSDAFVRWMGIGEMHFLAFFLKSKVKRDGCRHLFIIRERYATVISNRTYDMILRSCLPLDR